MPARDAVGDRLEVARQGAAQVAVAVGERLEGAREHRVHLALVQAQHPGDHGGGTRPELGHLLAGDEEPGDHPARVGVDAHGGADGEPGLGAERHSHRALPQATACCRVEMSARVDSAP